MIGELKKLFDGKTITGIVFKSGAQPDFDLRDNFTATVRPAPVFGEDILFESEKLAVVLDLSKVERIIDSSGGKYISLSTAKGQMDFVIGG